MANVNFSTGFDFTDESLIDFNNFVASDAFSYGWNALNKMQVTALSAIGNITVDAGNLPASGTIDAVIVIDPAAPAIAFTATGLNLALPAISPLAAEPFYTAILAGQTDFQASNAGDLIIYGDAPAAESPLLIASRDTFNISQAVGSPLLMIDGDFLAVLDTSTATGGDDAIAVNNEFGLFPRLIDGDSRDNAGVLNGGDDNISLTGGSLADLQAFVCGDANGNNGILNGGGDTIELTVGGLGTSAEFLSISGDAYENFAEVTGGNDTIAFTGLFPTPQSFLMTIAGDVDVAQDAASVITGGNDKITVTGAQVDAVCGDVRFMSAGTLTAGDDTIIVNSALGQFVSGDTVIFTGGTMRPGGDTIIGGSGGDTIFGESSDPNFPVTIGTTVIGNGNDVIYGGGGDDFIKGQVGNDTIGGGFGNDVLNGGSGIDTIRFDSIDSAVYVDLQGIVGTNTGSGNAEAIGQGIDQIELTERITGSTRNDAILGDANRNLFLGLAGDDKLAGRDGADQLIGGNGRDILIGGGGKDVYGFNKSSELTTESATTDVIRGFAGGDRIDLSGIDAALSLGKDQAFVFQTAPLTGEAQVTFALAGATTIISGSTDSDADAEFVIVLNKAFGLTATDFVL